MDWHIESYIGHLCSGRICKNNIDMLSKFLYHKDLFGVAFIVIW